MFYGLGLRVWVLVSRVFRVQDSGFRVWGFGFGFLVSGLGFRVLGFGFRIPGVWDTSASGESGALRLRGSNSLAGADIGAIGVGIGAIGAGGAMRAIALAW